jgi:putative DNA methylase
MPDPKNYRYDIRIRSDVSAKELAEAEKGTVRSDGRGQDPYLIHTVKGREYRTKISTLRGDFREPNGVTGNKLRLWENSDFKPRPEDIFQERLYAVQWMRPKKKGKSFDYDGLLTAFPENGPAICPWTEQGQGGVALRRT